MEAVFILLLWISYTGPLERKRSLVHRSYVHMEYTRPAQTHMLYLTALDFILSLLKGEDCSYAPTFKWSIRPTQTHISVLHTVLVRRMLTYQCIEFKGPQWKRAIVLFPLVLNCHLICRLVFANCYNLQFTI